MIHRHVSLASNALAISPSDHRRSRSIRTRLDRRHRTGRQWRSRHRRRRPPHRKGHPDRPHHHLDRRRPLHLPSLVVGTYTVAIQHPGFKAKRIENIGLNAFQQVALGNVVLEVGAPAESVTVTATAEQALVKDSAVRFATVQAKQVSEMPLAGRNWINLLKVIPGATPTNTNALNGREYTATGYSDFKINGKSGSQTQVNLDGGGIVDQGSDAKTSVAPILESIHQVSVLTNNFQAEYGNRGGTVINVVTKSGTNKLHATEFDYLNNEALNATTLS